MDGRSSEDMGLRRLSWATLRGIAVLAGAIGVVVVVGPWIWASTLDASETGSVGTVIMAGLALGAALLVLSRASWVASIDPAVLARDRDPVARRKATMSPSLTQDQLDMLLSDSDAGVRGAARAAQDERYRRRSVGDRRRSARAPDRPIDELRILVDDPDVDVRVDLARNEQVPPEIRVALARDPEQRVRRSAADSLRMAFRAREFSAEHWQALAENDHVDVRVEIAGNFDLPETEATRLSRDPSATVRAALAGNTDVPIDVLVEMAGDRKDEVRLAVAKNHATPLVTVARLADDHSDAVREAVIDHLERFASMKYDADGVAALAGARSVAARCAASDGIEVMPVRSIVALADDRDGDVRGHLATALGYRQDLPIELLWQLARSDDSRIRRQAAWHVMQREPSSVIAFATDRYEDLWEHIAGNPASPVEVLSRLAQRGNNYVRYRVAANPNTPPDTLGLLADRGHAVTSQVASDSFHERFGDAVVVNVAAHPNTPTETLTELANDRDRDVRCAVAANPSTERTVVASLAEDSDAEVRLAARGILD